MVDISNHSHSQTPTFKTVPEAASATLAAFFGGALPNGSFALPDAGFNWDRLIRQASSEHLLAGLADRARVLGAGLPLPPHITHVFTATEALNGQRNDRILAEAVFAARVLNQIGIQPVAIKGLAYLLSGVYPDPSTRYLADIDFLIPARHLSEAARQLLRNGFFEHEADIFIELRHHYPGLRRTGGPSIELHHQLGLGVGNRILPADQLIADSIPIEVEGAVFLIPSPNHLATHLILHSQLLHHPYHERVAPPLRALYDLKQLQTRFGAEIDWRSIAQAFAQAGQAASLHLHLAQAHEILGLMPPIPLQLGLLRRLRLLRRRLLYRNPRIRWFDSSYLLLSFFGRRLHLVPGILRSPSLWPRILKRLLTPNFYRNPFLG